MNNNKNIWVVCETFEQKITNLTFELLANARHLAEGLGGQVVAVLFTEKRSGLIEELERYGADKVILVEDVKFKNFDSKVAAHALDKLIDKYEPYAVLIGSSVNGRDIGGRITAKREIGLVADCQEIKLTEDKSDIMWIRPTFDGKLLSDIRITSTPKIGTVGNKTGVELFHDEGHKAEVIEEKIEVESPLNKILSFAKDEEHEHLSLEDAEVIVAAGMGVKDEEGLKVVKDFAKALGAEFGVTKPIVDNGWADKSLQVGVTGKTVKPKLYIAVGISGALQHTNGMKESELIIAINSDKDAKIMKIANYGIVGDLFTILPLLSERIREEKKVN